MPTSPKLRTLEGGWLELPKGRARSSCRSTPATPSGSGSPSPDRDRDRPYGRVLGEDRTPADGFRLLWRYPNEPLLAHLGIQATGPDGTAEETLDIVHPEP